MLIGHHYALLVRRRNKQSKRENSEKREALLKNWKIVLCALFFPAVLNAQCTVAYSEPDCSQPGALNLFEGALVGPGDVYIVNGTMSLNVITVNGGTLIICGTLNLNQLNFVTGNIVVGGAGAFNLLNPSIAVVFGANCTLINFGSVYSASSIVTGSNNLIVNYYTSSSINIPFNQLVTQGPNSQVVNNGILNTNFIVNLSNNTISPFCLGPGSVTSTGLMINQYPNAFLTPDPNSCIHITNTIMNAQTMTNTGNTIICYDAASVSVVGSPLFGNATVESDCPGCSVPLSSKIEYFDVANSHHGVELNWSVDNAEDVVLFEVEKFDSNSDAFGHLCYVSKNGIHVDNNYQFFDQQVVAGETYYYRVKLISREGNNSFSWVRAITYSSIDDPIFSPNPVTNKCVQLSKEVEIISVENVVGQRIPFVQESRSLYIDKRVSSGILLIHYEENGRVYMERILIRE